MCVLIDAIFHLCFVFFRLAVVTIGFSQAQYTVQESAGSLNVTVRILNGELDVDVTVRLATVDGSGMLCVKLCLQKHAECKY